MRARSFFVVALSAFILGLPEARIAFGAASNCGVPSDIHDGWAISSPEEQGLDSTRLCPIRDGIMSGKLPNVDDIVVVRHGVLVYESYYDYPHQIEYDATTRHRGYSMTKSVVSLLVGIAMDRGLIKDLDAPVMSYVPAAANFQSSSPDRVTLRHLLTMSAGLGSDRAPGASFEYNNRETRRIGEILTTVTGKNATCWLAKRFLPRSASVISNGTKTRQVSFHRRFAGWTCDLATGRKSASLFSTTVFGKVSRSFPHLGSLNPPLSRSRL